MGDNSTDWIDYLLETTSSSDFGILVSKLNDLNSSSPKEEVEVNKSQEQPAKMNSSAIEYVANASRDNHSQMEVFTQLENNMQDLGLLQQRSNRGRRKRCNETPEETARRAEEKKIKNRVSAARSRAKTNEHINNLESKVEQLKRDNELLERKIKFQVEMIKEDEEKTKAEKTRETSNRLRRAFSSSF